MKDKEYLELDAILSGRQRHAKHTKNAMKLGGMITPLVLVSIIVTAGIFGFFWKQPYDVTSTDALLIDNAPCDGVAEAAKSISLYPTETVTDDHTIRLDIDYPNDNMQVEFTVYINESGSPITDNEIICTIYEWVDTNEDDVIDDGELTELTDKRMVVLPALETNAQRFVVEFVADEYFDASGSYSMEVIVSYVTFGY